MSNLVTTIIPDNLRQELVNFYYSDNSEYWYAYNSRSFLDSNDHISPIDSNHDNIVYYKKMNAGRRTYSLKHNQELYKKVSAFGRLVCENEGLDTSKIVDIPQDQPLPHLLVGVFKDKNSKSLGVQSHTDQDASSGWMHVRINYMLQSPTKGGESVVNNKIQPMLAVGQGSVMLASRWLHRVMPVTGDRHRITLSLGYYVEPSYYSDVIARDYVPK